MSDINIQTDMDSLTLSLHLEPISVRFKSKANDVTMVINDRVSDFDFFLKKYKLCNTFCRSNQIMLSRRPLPATLGLILMHVIGSGTTYQRDNSQLNWEVFFVSNKRCSTGFKFRHCLWRRKLSEDLHKIRVANCSLCAFLFCHRNSFGWCKKQNKTHNCTKLT